MNLAVLQLCLEGVGLGVVMWWMTMRQLALMMQAAANSSNAPTYHDIWSVLDRYGLPMAILAIMFWFGYRIFWPFMVSLVTANQELMKTELAHAREEMKVQGERFVAALERRDEILKVEFSRLHEKLNEGFNEARGHGK